MRNVLKKGLVNMYLLAIFIIIILIIDVLGKLISVIIIRVLIIVTKEHNYNISRISRVSKDASYNLTKGITISIKNKDGLRVNIA